MKYLLQNRKNCVGADRQAELPVAVLAKRKYLPRRRQNQRMGQATGDLLDLMVQLLQLARKQDVRHHGAGGRAAPGSGRYAVHGLHAELA